jgi:lysophospholipase L1-like esterase
MARRILIPLLFIFLGIALAFGLLEAFVRITGKTPPTGSPAFFWQDDERFGWFHTPGAEGDYFNPAGEYHAYARVNSAGLIDQEYSLEKPEGVYRILVLGDSFAEGLRVPMDAAFHSILEEALNGAGKRVEVINGGVAGWGTDQQLLFYQEIGRNYDPDMVLLAFFPGNDVMNNAIWLEAANFGGVKKPYFLLEGDELVLHNQPVGSETDAFAPPPRETLDVIPQDPPLAFLQPWLERSAFYRYFVPRLRVAAPGLALKLAQWGLITPGVETRNAQQGPDYIPLAYGVYKTPLDAPWQDAWTVTEALLAELKRQVEEDGAELRVVVIPAQLQVEPAVWQHILRTFPAMQGLEWDVDQPNRMLAAVLQRQGTPYLDLLPIFRAWDGPSLFFPIDGHWNERGHRLAGEALFDWLQDDIPPSNSDASQ